MGCSASHDRAKIRNNGFNESLSTLDRKTSSRRKLSAEIRAMYTNFSPEIITILHFNDVYNIEPRDVEPVGGAARFATVVKELQHVNPLLLFSGDCLNPSVMSNVTRGRQMIPILNALKVHAAVYGNHDFDFGVDELNDIVMETNFPWLMSNVIDNLTEETLADGLIRHVIEWSGKKFGIIGLVEEEWLVTLATIDKSDLTYLDFVTHGRRLAKELKQLGADYVIALTHMRWPNDIRLAENVDEIDLILGGHDHDYQVKRVNGKPIVKSGSDFRTLTRVTIEFALNEISVCTEKINVTSDITEDAEIKEIVDTFQEIVAREIEGELGYIEEELDGRFSSIRTGETNLGNFVTDIMLAATAADAALLNSGTFRSDRIHPKGEICKRDLMNMLPLVDSLVVLEVTGEQLLEALENGVSQYPKYDGRFPQISSMRFGFDPSAEPGHRVDPYSVIVEGEHLLPKQIYRLCTKSYIAQGKDGYEMFKTCKRVVTEEEGPILSTIVQNHFNSIQMVRGLKPCRSGHRQSIVSLQKRMSLSKFDDVRCLEDEMSTVAPKLENRIYQLNEDQRVHLAERKKVFYEAVENGNVVLQKEHGKEILAAHLLVPTVSVTEASMSSDEGENSDTEDGLLLGLPAVNGYSEQSIDENAHVKEYEYVECKSDNSIERGLYRNENQNNDTHDSFEDLKVNGVKKGETTLLDTVEQSSVTDMSSCRESTSTAFINNNENLKDMEKGNSFLGRDGDRTLQMNCHMSSDDEMMEKVNYHMRRDDSIAEKVNSQMHREENFAEKVNSHMRGDDGVLEKVDSVMRRDDDDMEIYSIDDNTFSVDCEDDSVFIHDYETQTDSSVDSDSEVSSLSTRDSSIPERIVQNNADSDESKVHSELSEEVFKLSTVRDTDISEFFEAVKTDNIQEVQRLHDENQFDLHSYHDNKTVLHVAVESDATRVTRYLLTDCKMDPNITQKFTEATPLMTASQHGSLSTVQLLLQHGASVELKDSAGNTALKQACLHKQDGVKTLLLHYMSDGYTTSKCNGTGN